MEARQGRIGSYENIQLGSYGREKQARQKGIALTLKDKRQQRVTTSDFDIKRYLGSWVENDL